LNFFFIKVSSSNHLDDQNFLKVNDDFSRSLIEEQEFFFEIEKNSTTKQITLKGLNENFLLSTGYLKKEKQSFMLLVMLRHFAWYVVFLTFIYLLFFKKLFFFIRLPWRDHVKELEKNVSAFLKLKTQTVIVSFGNGMGAQRWLNQNVSSPHLHMITDEKRVLYKLFGLKKSFLKVWNTETLIYYAEQLALSRELPKSYQDVEDDPHQLGGNFIVEIDNEGEEPIFKAVFVYRSKNPPDRPSAQALLQFLSNKIENLNK